MKAGGVTHKTRGFIQADLALGNSGDVVLRDSSAPLTTPPVFSLLPSNRLRNPNPPAVNGPSVIETM